MKSAATKQKRYIRDTAQATKRPSGTVTATISFVVLALAMGFVIGFAVFAIMNLSTFCTDLLWGKLGGVVGIPIFPLIVCTLGGAVIGLWTWWSNDRVKPLSAVMKEFKQTGSYKTNGAVKPVVTFLLPLVFGGSIGFEAGLTGLITAGCCWIRDMLKKAGLRFAAVADATIAASFAAVFGTPLAGIVAGIESSPNDGSSALEEPGLGNYDMRRGAKVVLYTSAAFGAFGGIAAFSAIFGASGGLPRFEPIGAVGAEHLWMLLCIVVAYAMTFLFHVSRTLFGRISKGMGESAVSIVVKPIIAGVALGAIACVLPFVLFPGEVQSEELMETWTTWTAVALVGTGVLKAVATPMCIHMGWVGGDLFPSIFAGVSAGYGLAMITGADPMLMVTVTTTAFLAGVLRKPLLALAILLMCFPLNGLLWMGIAAVVGASLPLPRVLLADED